MTLIYTNEQLAIANYTGDLLVVKAGAGCAKTSTLAFFAQQHPALRMLYLVFGKANREDAEQRFKGTNVRPRTQHAIALARCGLNVQHKLTDNYRLTDIKQFLKLDSWALAQEVQDTFTAFLISDAKSIAEISADSKIRRYVTTLWDAARDGNNPFPCKPDVYLKHYCLMPPELHQWFNVILLDEGQDTNPVVSDWIMRQSCRKLIVGDDEQQLFGFRGAKNFLRDVSKLPDADIMTLSQSFRFGQAIAEIANAVIRLKYQRRSEDNELLPLTLRGTPARDTLIYARIPADWDKKPYTLLHRTTSGTIESGLDHADRKLYWIGGFDRYRAQDILDVYYLATQQRDKIVRRKLLTEAKSIKEYRLIAERTKDPEQARILRMLDKHFSLLPAMLDDLKKRTVTDPKAADLTLGTIHSAKGLEFPRVALADDFYIRKLFLENRIHAIAPEEFNLLYVAATRATEALACNDVLNFVIRQDRHASQAITYQTGVSSSGKTTSGAPASPTMQRTAADAPRTFSRVELGD